MTITIGASDGGGAWSDVQILSYRGFGDLTAVESTRGAAKAIEGVAVGDAD